MEGLLSCSLLPLHWGGGPIKVLCSPRSLSVLVRCGPARQESAVTDIAFYLDLTYKFAPVQYIPGEDIQDY